MARLEVSCRRLAIKSGVRQEAGNYAVCVHPRAAGLQRKGTLAVLAEAAGQHPSLGVEACKLAQSVVIQQYYGDHSLSLTTSLINALDGANSALLRYNYNEPVSAEGTANSVAVHARGVQTRRAKVGLAAVLIRPDGAGIYLSQIAPTQVYVRHNGLVTAIPEPASWVENEPEPRVTIIRPVHKAQSEDGGEVGEQAEEDTPALNVAAPALGSAPGIEVDLMFRRIEKGDLVVMVSSSLARHLDHATAESIFSSEDADLIAGALYSMATDMGIAEAHACVLQLGVETSSGVEADYSELIAPLHAEHVTANGGVRAVPPGPQPSMPNLKGALRGSKEWLSRKKQTNTEEESDKQDGNGTHEVIVPAGASARTMETSQQRALDVPPYRMATAERIESTGEKDGELEFDGWEDAPPVLRTPMLQVDDIEADNEIEAEPAPPDFVRMVIRPRIMEVETDSSKVTTSTEAISNSNRVISIADRPPSHYVVPTIFDPDDDLDGPGGAVSEPARPARKMVSIRRKPIGEAQSSSKRRMLVAGQQALHQTGVLLRSLLPERQEGMGERGGGKKKLMLPTRLIIALSVAVVASVLLFSVISVAGSQKQNAVTGYLEEARRLDLLANQPSSTPADKQKNLESALQKAGQALTTDPASAEGKLLVSKVEAELDKITGVTRLGDARLLFDLDEADKSAQPAQASGAGTGTGAKRPITATLQINDIVAQSNDAYILDREKGKIYRCRISTRGCTPVLGTGESAGGQKVGQLAAMTLRVGSLVAVDNKLTAYVYDADKSAWQAQVLGDASKLEQPKSIATYDGNLYLLGSKPSQISKYASGQYNAPPDDWIKDPASAEQVKSPVALAIDGSVYVLLQDGNIVVMEGGKISRTIAVKAGGAGAPTALFTGTDARDLYVLRSSEGTVTRISKEGQVIATFKVSGTVAQSKGLSGMTVDEGRGKVYLVEGRQVYEATLLGRAAPVGDQAPVVPAKTTVKPLAAP